MQIPDELLCALRDASHVVVLTGAGTSAESGVPTFREAQTGLWARYDPAELATPDAFARDPKLVWDWYAWRRQLCGEAQPNAGHRALVALSALLPKLTLVTQNVDGLHQRAGSTDVIELHGNLMRVVCSETRRVAAQWAAEPDPPVHPDTGALLRPDVVWFGEPLPADALARAEAAARECDVLLSVGTSSVVYPAAALPDIARQTDSAVIEVNPDETPLSARATWRLVGPSGQVLPALVHALE